MGNIIDLTALLFSLSELALVIWKRSRSKDVKIKSDRFSVFILWITFTLTILSSIYIGDLCPRNEQLNFLLWAGLVIVLLGFIIRWIAILQLDKAFTVDVSISLDHKIKDDGLYSTIRHPSYLGLLLELFGLSLMFSSWFPLFIINIPCFLALSYRIKIEEELLSSTFGKEYENYKSRTKKILPGIY